MRKAQLGKPWYVPEKDELLKYFDEAYTEDNASRRAYKDFLMRRMHCSDQRAENCIETTKICMNQIEVDFGELVDQLQREGLVINTEKQLDELMKYVTDFSNNLRIATNRGHTPNEMVKMKASQRGSVMS